MNMLPNIINSLLFLAIFTGICAGIIVLQVYLSKKDSRWPGLIMPILSFSLSVIIIFSLAAYATFQTNARLVRTEAINISQTERLDGVREAARDTQSPEDAERLAEMEALLESRIAHINESNRLTDYGRIRILPVTSIVFVFLAFNIPTAILLAIYAGCRGKRRRQRALEIMSLQDLG